ncbi:hypothetical protein FA15DRAFT_609812 [Coprinopsis marcescibilis]|uniref:Uncharacterized protein n=1 Tax=Coprinopsis marcescibilis TaxID=230819 RepID=A0A5C3LAK1_COPMA|nr:hypothetical protein FA15DRAFT_609812 [Coprinopsis marcescibilis]
MLLKKKRPSMPPSCESPATNTTAFPAAEHSLVPSSPPPSPTPNKRDRSTSLTVGSSSSSSPLRARLSTLTPSPSHLKSVVAKKVKRQIQRLDDALHTLPLARSRKTSGTPTATPEKRRDSKSRRVSEGGFASNLTPLFSSIAISFPSSPSSRSSTLASRSTSARKRTTSTPKDEDRYYDKRCQEIEERALRKRTISAPVVPAVVLIDNKRSAQMAASQHAVTSLMALSEEQGPYTEPEVPDPFLIDDEGDALSDDDEEKESSASGSSEGQAIASPAAADSVPLSASVSPSPLPLFAKPLPSILPPAFNSPNINKDVPPRPIDDLDDDDDVPEVSVPGLAIPTMFLPIPNTDPLTTLVNKYIYPPEKRPTRDVTGDWQNSDFHTLVMTNSWRALARMARDRIVASDPADVNLVLGLWYLRLSCLARLRLFNQTAAECTNLFTVLNAVEPEETREYLFDNILPFELEVMQTRLKYWSGDHMGYLDALSVLLSKCKLKARQAKGNEAVSSMWKERGARVILILASQLVEMKECIAATRLLEPLCQQKDVSGPALRSAVARIYLQVGNLDMAGKHFEIVAEDPTVDERQKRMNAALLASAQGDWASATSVLKEMIEKDNEDYAAVNNLSVALLSQGNLKEGIEVMETALKSSPSSVVVAEPFLFNLSTLYELQSTLGFEKKRQLLVEVAKWSGDGLKTSCLKLPSN